MSEGGVTFEPQVSVRTIPAPGAPPIANSEHPLGEKLTQIKFGKKKASSPLVPGAPATDPDDPRLHRALDEKLERAIRRSGPFFSTPERAYRKGQKVLAGSLYVPALKGPTGEPLPSVRVEESPEEVATTAANAAAAAAIVSREIQLRRGMEHPTRTVRASAVNLNAMAAAENRGEVSGVAAFGITPKKAGGAAVLSEILSSPIHENYFASNISPFAFFQIGKFYLTGDPSIKVKIISKSDPIEGQQDGDVVLLLKDAQVEFYNNNVLTRQAPVHLGVLTAPGQSVRYTIYEGDADEERPDGNFTGITEITGPASGGRRKTRRQKRKRVPRQSKRRHH
jgi:hypothetical protein